MFKILQPFIFTAILINLFFLCSAKADTLILKSGRSVQGEIIERTPDHIRIKINGLPIKYYIEEIESIDGIKLIDPGKAEEDELFYREKGSPKKWAEWYRPEIEKYISDTKEIFSQAAAVTEQALKDIDRSLKARKTNEIPGICRKAQNKINSKINKLEKIKPQQGFEVYQQKIISSCQYMNSSLSAWEKGQKDFAARKLSYLTLAMDAMKELRKMFNEYGASQEIIDSTTSFVDRTFLNKDN
ncbi:MAG: hypothetical protein JW867_04080 [Candidatus Omnitrophica bacterium]|nr:hypothetical protein [Candidatus Omnitrophota bacterium]